ncbi:MAG: TonB-dependent receptor [Kofleriaceae bacterium]|nr:TonB-dependent receptor [Kofleriaceae bacterium]MBP6841146.1 TonB-dependent receptor [Kofleriaceae bacterium]MBP9208109.1 TonB-dependent receptor [Kofleriaceae bacterium]
MRTASTTAVLLPLLGALTITAHAQGEAGVEPDGVSGSAVEGAPEPTSTAPADAGTTTPVEPEVTGSDDAEVVDDEEIGADEWTPDPGLVDYVAASTKLTEPSQRSPSSVWVVTREQIELAGYRSVAEALAEVPGLSVSYDLDNYNIALRGLYGGARAGSRYLKVMIDGRAVSFAQSGVHYLGPEFIPMVAVERIELVRGPVSSLYGAGALVGAINIVTRRPSYEGELTMATIVELGGLALGQVGGIGQGVQMVVGKRSFGLLAVGGAFLDRSGLEVPVGSAFRSEYCPDGACMTSEGDTNRPISVLARGEQYLAGGRLSGVGTAQLHDAANEFHDLTVMSHNSRSSLYVAGLGLNYERPTSSGVTVLGSAGLWFGGTRGGEAYDLGASNMFTLQRDLGYRLIEGGLEVRYDRAGGWLLVGFDAQLDQERLPEISEVGRADGEVRVRTASVSQSLNNLAGYAQVLVPLHAKLRLAGNLRWDQHNIYGGAASARAALVAALHPRVSLKLMGGRSYKAPSPEQLFGVGLNQLDVSGDEEIRPQYLNGVEAQADVFLATQLRLAVGGYFQRYNNTLSYQRIGTGLVANGYDADSYGVEASLRGRFDLGAVTLDGAAGLTLQQMVTDATLLGGVVDKPVPDNEGVATRLFNGRLAAISPGGAAGQVQIRYSGRRTPSQSNLLLDGGTPDMSDPSYMLGAFALLDVTLASPGFGFDATTRRKGTFKLRGGVANLLDRRYAEVGFNGVDVPGLGRTIWLAGTVKL